MRMQRSGFNDGKKSVHDRKVLIVVHDKFRHSVSTGQNDWKSSIMGENLRS